MKISLQRRGDYAVRAVLHLARYHGVARRKSRDIAEDMKIPAKFLPQVLGDLVRAGYVSSASGPDGGYSLAREPEDISLLQIVELAEGPLRSGECVIRGGPCRWDDACAVHEAFAEAQDHFESQLASTSFADLAAVDAALAGPRRGRRDGVGATD